MKEFARVATGNNDVERMAQAAFDEHFVDRPDEHILHVGVLIARTMVATASCAAAPIALIEIIAETCARSPLARPL
jgi:hypothetical protein